MGRNGSAGPQRQEHGEHAKKDEEENSGRPVRVTIAIPARSGGSRPT